jgi:HPt (histidine-containing phosphotransfer) domain-containing protein
MTPRLDLPEILERFGDDADMMREIAALFLEQYGTHLDDVRVAIGQRDAARLSHAAHALKGMAANFSRDAAEAAHALELLGRSGSLAGAEEAFAALEEQLAALVQALAALVTERVC